MNPIVVNFFAGPGTGKSTMAATVFSQLKWNGINCELVTEYAKDKVWENSIHILDNQLYIFAKQYHKMYRLRDKVDVIITDSPLLLSLIYGDQKSKAFNDLVIEKFHEFDNLNYRLQRRKSYMTQGRMQTEDEAKQIDAQISMMLTKNSIDHIETAGIEENADKITQFILQKLKSK